MKVALDVVSLYGRGTSSGSASCRVLFVAWNVATASPSLMYSLRAVSAGRVASCTRFPFFFPFPRSSTFERFIAGQFQTPGTVRGGGRFRNNCAATQ